MVEVSLTVRFSTCCVLLFIAAGALAGCSEQPATALVKRSQPVSEAFQRYCAMCHGERGEGAVADHANAIGNPAFLSAVSDEFLFESIRRGRPGTPMSAFGVAAGGPLADDEIRELIRFLRAFQLIPSTDTPTTRTPVDRARAARARPVYAERCASCHGDRGQGVTAPSLNNPVFHALASDHLLTSAITEGRPGTLMAGFGGSLSATEIEDLIHFLRDIASRATAPDTSRAGVAEPWTTDESIPVVHNPEGEAPAFAPANAYVPAAQVNLALQQGRRMVLLDARAPSDWRAQHLPGALPAPFYDDPAAFRRVPNDGTQIVVYCGCPHVAADRVANALRGLGYAKVAVIEEGLWFWRDQGYPLVTEPEVGAAPHAGGDAAH